MSHVVQNTMLKTFAKQLFFVLFGLVSLAVLAPSAWLLFQAQTWTGRGLACIGFATVVLPWTAYLARRRGRHRRLWTVTALISGLGLVGLVAVILLRTPSGRVPPDSPVQHRFTTPTAFRRYRISNIVPEAEQVNLGFLLMSYLDPLLTREQAARVSDFTLAHYRELERAPHFHQLGSVMGYSYADRFGLGQPADAGHYYLYVPENRGEGPLPALVFLHGSAGNFKAYLWTWSKLAEERGMVIVAPSFGFGNWLEPGASDAVLRALDDAATVVQIDEERVFLAGISNGGLGVSKLSTAAPERFRGLIFVSPMMASDRLESQTFRENWQARPVLVVTGEADKRVPYTYVQRHVRFMKDVGARVTAIAYPGEDHFLLLSQPEAVLQDVSEWYIANEETSVTP